MNKKIINGIAQTVQYGIALTSVNELLQFIELGLAIICSLIIIIPKIVEKIKSALKDGKLTKEEIEDITKEVKDATEEIKNTIKKEK